MDPEELAAMQAKGQGQPPQEEQPQPQPQQGEPQPEGQPSEDMNVDQYLQVLTESEIPQPDKLEIALDWLLDIVDLDPNSPQLVMELVSKNEAAKGLFSQLFQQTDDTTLLEQEQQQQEQPPQEGPPQQQA